MTARPISPSDSRQAEEKALAEALDRAPWRRDAPP